MLKVESVDRSIGTALPALYRHILPPFFTREIPSEDLATCSNCAMACPGKNGPQSTPQFDPSLKCCTFQPSLPNYLVGAIISSPISLPVGAKRIQDLIVKRHNCTPAGIHIPRLYDLLYASSRRTSFGKSRTLLCPYFSEEAGGTCTIWSYREAVCTTYFCKHVGGRAGSGFWSALKAYLLHLQSVLAKYCVLAASAPISDRLLFEKAQRSSADRDLSLEDIEQKAMAPQKYNQIWGDWAGREEEYFIGCYQSVLDLTKEKYSELAGIDETIHMDRLLRAYLKLTDIPKILKFADNYKSGVESDEYIEADLAASGAKIKFPRALANAFDGTNDTPSTLQSLSESGGLEVHSDFIAMLYHNGVLLDTKRP